MLMLCGCAVWRRACCGCTPVLRCPTSVLVQAQSVSNQSIVFSAPVSSASSSVETVVVTFSSGTWRAKLYAHSAWKTCSAHLRLQLSRLRFLISGTSSWHCGLQRVAGVGDCWRLLVVGSACVGGKRLCWRLPRGCLVMVFRVRNW